MRQLTQREVQARQMVARFAPRAQQPRSHQRPEPRPVLQRLDRDPGIIDERGRKEGRQRPGVLDPASPLLEAVRFVPIQIVDEGERVLRASGRGAGEHAVLAFERGIDGGELGREGVIVKGALPCTLPGRILVERGLVIRNAARLPFPALAQGRET